MVEDKLSGCTPYPDTVFYRMMIDELANGDKSQYDFIKFNFSSIDYYERAGNTQYRTFIQYTVDNKK